MKDAFKKFDKDIAKSIKKLEKEQAAARKKRNLPDFRFERLQLVKNYYKAKSHGKK